MAERTIVVCDICGKPATETVTIKAARGNFAKDLCATHVAELTAGARRPRPGRPRKLATGGTATAPRRRGRPRKSSARSSKAAARKKTAGKKTAGRKTAGRKKTAGRRKAQASPAGSTAS